MIAAWQVENTDLQPLDLQIADRGFQYGDGFFTTALVVDAKVLNWPAHLRRLRSSASRLYFSVDAKVWSDLEVALAKSYAALSVRSNTLVVKIIVTRGVGGRGYRPSFSERPHIFIQWSEAPVIWEEGSSLLESEKLAKSCTYGVFNPPKEAMICQFSTSINPGLAGVKHLNRLENVLARAEPELEYAFEGIMLDPLGMCVCGTQSNLFLIEGSQLITPKLHRSGVEGTARYLLSQHAAELGFDWREVEFDLDRVWSADEVFFSNAIRGIQPVSHIEDHEFKSDKTHALQSLFWSLMTQNGLALSS
jgi:4-amino-4-deoxychorismate lyase